MDREQRVRQRAHAIWEEEGRPSGCEQAHWERASREIDEQDSVTPAPAEPEAMISPTDGDFASGADGDAPATTTTRKRATKAKPAGATPRAPRSKAAKKPA